MTVYKDKNRWVISYPQRHFVTNHQEGNVFHCESFFSSFKDAVLYGKDYKINYTEWTNIEFLYICNHEGKTELHDLCDDDTVLEFILRLNE